VRYSKLTGWRVLGVVLVALAAAAACSDSRPSAAGARSVPLGSPVARGPSRASVPVSRRRPLSLRVLVPVTTREPERGLPPNVPATLLAFGAEGPGLGYVYDTATSRGYVTRLPTGFSRRVYQRLETGPNYGQVEQAGDRFVMSGGPHSGGPWRLMSVPSLRSRVHTDIRPPGGYFPSFNDQDLWVERPSAHGQQVAVDINPDTGAELGESAPLSRADEVVAQLSDGLLTIRLTHDGADAAVSVVIPVSGRTVRLLTPNASGETPVLSAVGDIVAWQGPGECAVCQIHLTNLRTGATQAVRWDPPRRFVCDLGALSPNGDWLAVSYGCPRPDPLGRGVLLLVNTITGRTHLVPSSAQPEWGTPGWSQNSQWLFWDDAGGARHLTMRAYHPGQTRAYSFNVPEKTGGGLLQTLRLSTQTPEPEPYNDP
jgi:hypothetical protein